MTSQIFNASKSACFTPCFIQQEVGWFFWGSGVNPSPLTWPQAIINNLDFLWFSVMQRSEDHCWELDCTSEVCGRRGCHKMGGVMVCPLDTSDHHGCLPLPLADRGQAQGCTGLTQHILFVIILISHKRPPSKSYVETLQYYILHQCSLVSYMRKPFSSP